MKKILLLASILYLFIAPLTYHPDNKTVLRWISSDYIHVWNIYEHTQKVFGEGGIFNYPPVHFGLAKLEWPIANIIGGKGYTDWLNKSDYMAIFDSYFFRFNLATKLPLIMVSLLVGWQIYDLAMKFYNDKKRSLLAASLWFFNPITIYSIPIMGQNDVLAIALFLAGWRFINVHSWLGIVFFGMSISVKSYPLIWLVFLVVSTTNWKWMKKITIVVGAYLINFLTTLPFISTPAYQEAVNNSAINNRFFIPNIDIGYEEAILLVPAALLGFALGIVMKTSKERFNQVSQSWIIVVVNLLLLGLTHFHPQWFTWIIPFWALWIVSLSSIKEIRSKLLFSSIFMMLWSLIIILFKDKFLTWGIITPLNPNIINLPLIHDFLVNKNINVSLIINSFHTFLAVLAIFLAFITISSKLLSNKKIYKTNNFALTKIPVIIKISLLILPTILIFIGFLVGALIPAPIGVFPDSDPYYVKFPAYLKSSFLVSRENLNRIDLFFKNPNLDSKDTFSFNLLSHDGSLIYNINSSAMNSGDPSLLRFDFPPIEKSKGQYYDLLLIKTSTNGATRLEVGMESIDHEKIYIRQFYKPIISSSNGIDAAISNFFKLITQLWWWYLLLHLGLILFSLKKNE